MEPDKQTNLSTGKTEGLSEPNLDPQIANTPKASPDENTSKSSKLRLKVGLVIVVVALLIFGTWLFYANSKPSTRTVKIGVFEATSGENVVLGQAAKQGVTLAEQQLSTPGLNVELYTYNAACDNQQAINGIKSLAAKGVVAIIGDFCSGTELALAPTANRLHVVMVSPSATAVALNQAGPYIFRVIPDDAFSAKFATNLIYKAGVRKLAILYTNEAYGQGLNAAGTADFKADGGTVVDSQGISVNAVNVTAQMQNIKAANPDGIYIAANGPDSIPVAILTEQKALMPTVPVFSSETLYDPVFLADAGALADGLTTIAVTNGTPSFEEMSQAAYGKAPDIYAAQSYDAYKAIYEAIKMGASTGPEVQKDLFKVNFNGASGHIAFTSDRFVQSNYLIYKVINSQFVLQQN